MGELWRTGRRLGHSVQPLAGVGQLLLLHLKANKNQFPLLSISVIKQRYLCTFSFNIVNIKGGDLCVKVA